MAACSSGEVWEVGALSLFEVRMVVGFGKVLCQAGMIIFSMWSLWLVRELVLVSGKTSGVGIDP